jgi:hypothetical protein
LADWQSNTKLGAEYRPSIFHMLPISMHHVDVNAFKDTINLNTLHPKQGTRWRNCLWHSGTIRKVAGSNPDGIIGNFHGHIPSGRTVALGSNQSLTEMSKGKTVPLQAWTGPQGSRRLRSSDFLTSAHEGGRLSALHTGRLYPQD